jgi:glucose-6-phosphate-specific signal transduction histidine kinase
MDADVQKILSMAEQMKVTFKKLEARRTLPFSQQKAIESAANSYRFFERTALSEFRIAFDPEYKAEMERLTIMVKGKLKLNNIFKKAARDAKAI